MLYSLYNIGEIRSKIPFEIPSAWALAWLYLLSGRSIYCYVRKLGRELDLNFRAKGIFGILNGSKLEFDRLRFGTSLTLNSKTVKTNVLNKLPPRLFST